MKPYLMSTAEVISALHSREDGLTDNEANERIAQHGKNKLADPKKISIISRVIKQAADPMIIMLLIATAISAVTAILKNEPVTDAIIIFAVIALNIILGVVQESKAENAINALKSMSQATAKVMRDGKLRIISTDDVTVGDIIILEAGDAVPADARVIASHSLQVESAALTGESVPVNIKCESLTEKSGMQIPTGDRVNMVYSGSTVVYGRGSAIVCETGMNTELGKIAACLSAASDSKTPLQIKMHQLSKVLTYAVIAICVIVFGVELLRTSGITVDFLLDSFMIAVSLAVAAIPEGLSAVVTVLLSVGVTKMAKRNAIVRKLTAVETLGCTQVVCSDKTGTLTQNKMTVVRIASTEVPDGEEAENIDVEMLAVSLSLCSDAELNDNNVAEGEPTECALVNYALSVDCDKRDYKKYLERIGEAPFDSSRKMMSTIHKVVSPILRLEADSIVQFTKGAIDEVLPRCTHILLHGEIVPMTDELYSGIMSENTKMTKHALRVLCTALRMYGKHAPLSQDPACLEQELCYIGIVGMIDPIRPEVLPAITECIQSGIRPIMITGDHKDTAIAIATQLGMIDGAHQALSGTELDGLSDEFLDTSIENYSVYARVQPEHKVRIVRAWQKKGMVTAMTGDGVNDAPSIKTADIGIGMGITGTDVTKSVADMVLADDNFATIVSAIEEGRRIYDNIKKAIQFLLASNLSEVITVFVSSLFGFGVLAPVHLLFINLVTDTFPALGIGMEQAESNLMKRPPRSSSEGIFANGLGTSVIIEGVIVSLITFAAFFLGHYLEYAEFALTDSQHGTTMAFLTLCMTEIFHSLNMRSTTQSIFTVLADKKRKNTVLLLTMLASFAISSAVVLIPFMSNVFGFVTITYREYLLSIGLALLIIPIMEVVKLIKRSKLRKK